MNQISEMYKQAQEIQAPSPAQIPHRMIMHGHERNDPFYWMNQREDPKVLAYLEAENEYTKAVMRHTQDLQATIFDEIKDRIPQREESAPYFKNGYYYYSRFEPGKEYPLYCRKISLEDSAEEILLDVNELAKDHDYYQLGGLSISPDNRFLIFGEDTISRRIYTLRLKDLKSGKIEELTIPGTTGSVAWANDSKTFFYTEKDESLRPHLVRRHILGADPKDAVVVYEESDETFISYVYRSVSGEYIMIGCFQSITTEFRFLSANDPLGQFQVFNPRERGHEYFPEHLDDHFYIRTNWLAQNFRIMKCQVSATERSNWTEWQAHKDDVLIENLDLFRNYIAISERTQGLPRIAIHPTKGEPYYLPFQEAAFVVHTAQNYDPESHKIRIIYSSMTTPVSTYDFDMKEKSFELKKRQEVVGGYSPEDYYTERLMAHARDGRQVPVTLVYKKGVAISRDTPLLLYGYGSYGHSIDPGFSAARLSLLDRGFIFAIAHIRGGEDLGRAWYDEGKLLSKKNTFYDFIDAAQYLISREFTSERTLFAMGGSAGGLLMGAVINERPDLWKGVIAAVPFVDVVTTMLDDSIPLTTGEYDEWGNPNDEDFYHYMLSYSPYDNVGAKEYPAMLVTTGLHDSQVQYWEPAKWVAKIRLLKTGEAPVLLHTNLKTGHSGASGRFERFKETALEYAFLLDLAGKNNFSSGSKTNA